MGWKSALRSIEAAQRRSERESRRRQRNLEQRQKEYEKMQELERATYEVEVYENYIARLLSVHKECGPIWDWEYLHSAKPPPVKPRKFNNNQEFAQEKLDGFKPGIIDKLLARADKKRDGLAKAVESAKKIDEQKYQNALKTYENDYADWKTTCELAEKILEGDATAYLEAIKQINPFSEIRELGSTVQFQVEDGSCVEAILHVNNEKVIPSETKSLLKSGKLSVKKTPKGKFYELYQDYVCGGVLRVARELFVLLPIKIVIVTAITNLLNPKTGHMEEQPILSVAIPRKTLEGLNFEMLDPSNSMSNFVHQMKFQKTKGFKAVERVSVSELQLY